MQTWQGKYVPILAWVDGVPVEGDAITQLKLATQMPFMFKHIAAMPDMHVGAGCCIGTVLATRGAVIPSAVGLDLGCGMTSILTNLTIDDIPPVKRPSLRAEIERKVPTGRSNHGGPGDKGAWRDIPKRVINIWRDKLERDWISIIDKHPKIKGRHTINHVNHLGTLGGGNHFIEICVDFKGAIWIMLHSGSRGVGNNIGQYFIKQAKDSCKRGNTDVAKAIDKGVNSYLKCQEFRNLGKNEKRAKVEELRRNAKEQKDKLGVHLPHPDLAYFEEGTGLYNDYIRAATWAQEYARLNRLIMLENVMQAVRNIIGVFNTGVEVNCHHNYVSREVHYGESIIVTRKGAISAKKGELGIIPGSMGDKSYIVKGKGNVESFHSASHGAGRRMSRGDAKRTFTVEEHCKATEGVECSKSKGMLDETPMAYKDIDTVMAAEKDLVMPIHELKQIICVKGGEHG